MKRSDRTSSSRPRAILRLALLAALGMIAPIATADDGMRPIGADGKPLNLGFEDGTLKDWTASGDAFKGQPVKGDTVSPRRSDMHSNHAGQYWIGTFEKSGDEPKGTLTSASFKVTQPWATFLFNGGAWPETRVELVRADTGKVFFQTSGNDNETMGTVIVDLKEVAGQQIFIRLVDDRSDGWGHVNFDEFLFHDAKPTVVANVLKPTSAPPPLDEVKYAGLSPQDAIKAMEMPPGFKATLFAAEPDIVQPIAFTIDARGRLWVVQAMTYPIRAAEGKGNDSIFIFEDTDGDGKFDKKTVFAEGLNLVSGIEVGFGGVFVGAAPYLMFIPDKNGDDKPDGPPEILLDGWGYEDTHEVLNTFTWGPDGWLYGNHGVFTHSHVGKPGTPADKRVALTAGVWRYHPVRKEFEVFAEGTSNPWGIDFDENGQLWAEACVIPHLWHLVQGGRFQRQAGNHENPFTYEDIKQSADHVHYAGDKGPHAGNGRSDAMGGGHAHAGLMIYQGDNWPAEYRGKIFMGNIHGQRINMDVPEVAGSGYVGHHGADLINFQDRWSQVINFRSGPDGGVYFIDWYDAQQCHVPDPLKHDRTNGRIFKITYGEPKAKPVDLTTLSDKDLVLREIHGDAWNYRTALRVLTERSLTRELDADAKLAIAQTPENEHELIRSFWLGNAIGKFQPQDAHPFFNNKLSQDMNHLTGWMIRQLCEGKAPAKDAIDEFVQLAKGPRSPIVRLYLASAVQRIPDDQKWDIVARLISHAEDSNDHNLPLMYWYAAEPLADVDASRALALALDAKTPYVLNFMARKLSSLRDGIGLPPLVAALGKLDDADARRVQVLQGMADAIGGQGRQIAMPEGWVALEAKLAASSDAQVKSLTQTLAITFGSKAALGQMRNTLADASAPEAQRKAAIETLVSAKDPEVLPLLQSILSSDGPLRGPALRGLAAFDDAKTPSLVVDAYASLTGNDKRDAINTLASRPAYATALLDAVDAKKVPASDVTADVVRQLRNLGDKSIDGRLDKSFAMTRKTPDEKLKAIAAAKAMLTSGAPGDASRGRVVFTRTCAQCHTLFDAGGAVGPNITGANRADLDYLLLNIIDPNAVIPAEYRTTIVKTKDGRVLTGIVKKQDDNAVTLQAANEVVIVPRKQIDRMKDQELSMMPEGLFDGLKEPEKRDLIKYLQGPKQVQPAGTAPAAP